MNMVQAIAMLDGPEATRALEEQAFRSGEDFSQSNAAVSAFQLWDRIGRDPTAAIAALGAVDPQVADRAEWMLVEGGAAVLPQVREAIQNKNAEVRRRAIHIVAWQGDRDALDALHSVEKTNPEDANLAAWAVEKIDSLHPQL